MALAKRDIAGMDGAQLAVGQSKDERAIAIQAVKPALDEHPLIPMDLECGANRVRPGKPRLGKQQGW